MAFLKRKELSQGLPQFICHGGDIVSSRDLSIEFQSHDNWWSSIGEVGVRWLPCLSTRMVSNVGCGGFLNLSLAIH